MEKDKDIYYVPVTCQVSGRIPVRTGNKNATTEEIFRIAEEALKEISLSELDMLTDYVPETKHIDKEGLILDYLYNPLKIIHCDPEHDPVQEYVMRLKKDGAKDIQVSGNQVEYTWSDGWTGEKHRVTDTVRFPASGSEKNYIEVIRN